MKLRSLALGCLALLIAACSTQADIVAIKRGSGLTLSNGLDSRFATPISGGTITVYSGAGMAGDTEFWDNPGYVGNNCYVNYGGVAAISYGRIFFLSKFNTQVLPGFLGGRINKAQLRFYYQAGNTGMANTGYVTSSDWIEGTCTGQYPGAAGGASYAHPKGHNTGPNQDTNGGTTGPLQSWALNSYFAIAKDVSTASVGVTRTGYSARGDTYGGFAVYDVTSFVQLWANGTPSYGFCTYDTGWNYTTEYSETTFGDDFQPVLVIDYDKHGTPNAITNLTAGNPDWFKVDLTWTAPSANPSAAVASYDIRYSTSPITDDTSFSNASKCTCKLPTPAAPGTTEHFTITGLSASTTYYFAIKSTDIIGTVSPLSNAPVSATTIPLDVVPPAQITTLAAPTVKPNYVTLTWNAVGDDGVTGLANDYDLRYSTSPITDDASFSAGTRVVTLGSPKAPGQQETVTIHGLTPSTVYYFAIKAGDEVPNWSTLSNVVVVTTLATDLLPPNTVTTLRVSAIQITSAYLSWPAPADQGTAGLQGYDIRYSTSPIDESNWASATQVSGEPTPSTPGLTDRCTISGLTANTTYYFAVKSFDYAEPSNVSAISNIASGKTMPPIVPVTVHNPWLANDRVADTRNLDRMGATYINSYQPSGVTVPTTDEQKAINIYDNQKRRLYHWADENPNGATGYNNDDPTANQNIFGWSLCGRHACQGLTIAQKAGLGSRKISFPGHWTYEVQYHDGTWHQFDTMCTHYIYTRGANRHVASCAEGQADNTLETLAVAEGRACPGYLLCGDTAADYVNYFNHWGADTTTPTTPTWTADMDLRIGQSFKRTWESWLNQHPTPSTDADSISGVKDPPFHHEANKDWKDTVNFPYWEPYTLNQTQNAALNIGHPVSYRRWANGTDTLAPDFRSAAYQAMLYSSTNIATYNDDALSPDLHTATVGTTSEAVFKINVPYYITDANFSGTFVRTNSGDVCNVQVSTNGTSWTTVWTASSLGTTTVTNQPLRSYVFPSWKTWYIKVQLKSTVAKSDAGVSNFVVTTIFEHNKGSMAYLDKGLNNITLTFDNPAELAASGNVLHVFYKWKEFDGTDWTVDRQFETYVTTSPATFSITTGGTKVPRTEYILLEVTPPPSDPYAPGLITDLVAGTAQATKVPLTFTASGDDGYTGTATSYEIRYSTSPITDDVSFSNGTLAASVPSPKPAGTTEHITINGLAGSTTYWLSIKVHDKGGNISDMSNVVTFTTTPPDLTAPQAVNSLVAQSSKTAGGVDLTWSAPADYGANGSGPYTCASYDLRYSINPITDDTTFNAATAVTGLTAPKAPGGAEAFTVTGLTGGTRYYFAIKSQDDSNNVSAISNSTNAKASVIGEKTFQVGLNGYMGEIDAYVYVGAATTNYGSTERMTVCGYGAGAYSRGLVKFDLSSLPAGTTIASATLSLYSYNAGQTKGSSGAYGLYPLTKAFTETGVTWNTYDGTHAWSTLGGDFLATPDATAAKKAPAGAPYWYSWDVTSRVQSWLNSTSTNNGWVIKCTDESANNQDWFYQLDTANASLRPMLVISDIPAAVDTTPPAAVTNLAGTGLNTTSVKLTWTATGDDGSVGTATSYNLRYSTTPITNLATFNAATAVTGLTAPKASGQAESFTISGLTASTTYYFALVVNDEASNASGLSNVATVATLAPRKTGDINYDGYVNVGDLQALVAAWGSDNSGAWGNWNPSADLNNDGFVNVSDLQILVVNWGK